MKSRIFKTLSLVALACGSFEAKAECNIDAYSTDSINRVFYEYGGWSVDRGLTVDKFNEICEKLRAAKAGIEISGMAMVLEGYSVSWAEIRVKDLKTSIGNLEYGSKAVQLSNVATQSMANDNMVLAINKALQNWLGVDLAIENLEKERKIARQQLLKKK